MVPQFPAPAQAAVPSNKLHLRDRILQNVRLKGTDPIFRTSYTTDDKDIIIRIPRNVMYADIRVKDEKSESGKPVESTTLVVSATAEPGTDRVCTFVDQGAGKVVSMPCKQTLNLNIGFEHRNFAVDDIANAEQNPA